MEKINEQAEINRDEVKKKIKMLLGDQYDEEKIDMILNVNNPQSVLNEIETISSNPNVLEARGEVDEWYKRSRSEVHEWKKSSKRVVFPRE